MTVLLETRDVVKSFGGVRAVDGVSLGVDTRSITALIGPNGAGKSTLFNCIAGALRADGGHVYFSGRRIDRRSRHFIARNGLGRTFQAPRTLKRLSVLDNVALAATSHPGERLTGLVARPGAARRREREARVRALELLELVGLAEHAGAYAGTLSGGQRKLLDLARVLMLDPVLVLLDEPMAGVNPVLRAQLLEHVRHLRRERGITFLIVEHDIDFVMQAADSVIVMNQGRVIATGPPAAVRADATVIDAYLGSTHEQPVAG
ncbi:MAG TPA: ABC transporter ATP-binding protein [Gaiellaceae bacterium]|nr:ABC transporter ATP-binding protein [Gaiellaceae bacterium]